MYTEKVQRYYDYTLNLYKVFWHGDTRALHYGIWDKNTKNLKEALLNTNKFLATKADIKDGQKVLDAGCGVGGSLFWLAKNYYISGQGITLSQKQFEKATELNKRFGLQNKLTFSKQDFIKTNFSDNTFDVVWAIESVCHAINKEDFIKEAFRVLKKGGKLIVSDDFLERKPSSTKEQVQVENFLKGWALDNLAFSSDFKNSLESLGFEKVECFDATNSILPTASLMRRMSNWSYPLSKITTALKLTPQLVTDNNQAGIDQYDLFKEGVMSYKVFIATRP